MFDSDLNSGFIEESHFNIANHFTDIQLIHPSKNGYSEVFKAKRYGKWFTLKRLVVTEKDNVRFQSLLEKEFTIANQLSHPNIVNTIGFEEVPELGICLIQEYIDGMTLDEFLFNDKTNKQEIRQLINELCDALQYIHNHQIVHRDLKPNNILITRDGHHVKLIDFGLADTDCFDILKEPAGTKGYASPEQQTKGKIDNRADIYALGRIIKSLPRTTLKEKRIARRCLSENPDKRFASANEIKRKLNSKAHLIITIVGLILAAFAFAIISSTQRKHEINELTQQENESNHQTDSVINQMDSVIKEKQQQIDELSQHNLTLNHQLDSIANERYKEQKVERLYDSLFDLVEKYAIGQTEEIKRKLSNLDETEAFHQRIQLLSDLLFYHGQYSKALLDKVLTADDPNYEKWETSLKAHEERIYTEFSKSYAKKPQ